MSDYKYVNDMIEEIDDRSSKVVSSAAFTSNMLLNDNWEVNESMFNDSDYLIVDELSQNEHLSHHHHHHHHHQPQPQPQQQHYHNNVLTSKTNEFANNFNEPSEILWLISYNVTRIIDKIGQESIDNHCGNKVEKYKRKKYKQPKFEQNNCLNVNGNGTPGTTTTTTTTTTAKSTVKKANSHSKNGNNPKSKPPYTYTELIEHALIDKGELTVSGIYKWISEHYPFYDMNDDRWKNSVRHNLSICSSFRKGGKTGSGAGHLWTTIAAIDKNRSNSSNETKESFIANKKSRNHIKREYRSKEKKTNQKIASVEYPKMVKQEQVSLDYFSAEDDDCFAPSNDNELIEEVVTGFAPDDPLFANEMIDSAPNFDDDDLPYPSDDYRTYGGGGGGRNTKTTVEELDIENCPMNFNDENIFEN